MYMYKENVGKLVTALTLNICIKEEFIRETRRMSKHYEENLTIKKYSIY